MWHAYGDAHIHANGDSDSYIHANGDSNCHIHSNGDSDIYCNSYRYCDSNCYSNGDRTAAAFTDATASADAAAACGQLL